MHEDVMNAHKPTDKQAQLDRFKEVARQLGCDEDGVAFDEN
jgi:hypothetical protein